MNPKKTFHPSPQLAVELLALSSLFLGRFLAAPPIAPSPKREAGRRLGHGLGVRRSRSKLISPGSLCFLQLFFVHTRSLVPAGQGWLVQVRVGLSWIRSIVVHEFQAQGSCRILRRKSLGDAERRSYSRRAENRLSGGFGPGLSIPACRRSRLYRQGGTVLSLERSIALRPLS